MFIGTYCILIDLTIHLFIYPINIGIQGGPKKHGAYELFGFNLKSI